MENPPTNRLNINFQLWRQSCQKKRPNGNMLFTKPSLMISCEWQSSFEMKTMKPGWSHGSWDCLLCSVVLAAFLIVDRHQKKSTCQKCSEIYIYILYRLEKKRDIGLPALPFATTCELFSTDIEVHRNSTNFISYILIVDICWYVQLFIRLRSS